MNEDSFFLLSDSDIKAKVNSHKIHRDHMRMFSQQPSPDFVRIVLQGKPIFVHPPPELFCFSIEFRDMMTVFSLPVTVRLKLDQVLKSM